MVRRFHRGNFARSSCKWIGRELHADYLACQFEPELSKIDLTAGAKLMMILNMCSALLSGAKKTVGAV